MEPGEKCICQVDDLYNAYGELSHALHRGMRLTVIGSHNICGTRFYFFKETPEGTSYIHDAFLPMRRLN